MKIKEQLLSLEAYTPGMTPEEVKEKYNLSSIIKLASNENPYGTSSSVLEAISKNPNFSVYPDGAATNIREAVAEHVGVEKDQLIFSSGLDELIQILSRAFLSSETNTVMAEETFSQYRHHAVIEGAEIKEIPLKNGIHDLDGMLEAIDDKTSIVWICNPNNPTGTYVNKVTLDRFLSVVPKHVLVVIDEAYYEYATIQDYPQTIPLLSKYENLLVMRTFSKAYGLAAFRIGYGIGAPALINRLDVSRLPFNTSALAQTAGITALDDLEFIEECIIRNANEREKYYEFFDQYKIPYYQSQANFIYLPLPTIRVQEMFQSLLEKGWIVRAFPNGLRITVGTEEQNEQLIKILAEMLAVKH